MTEPAAVEILRALETRLNWYEARRKIVPIAVLDAIDAIAPVVTRFRVAREERAAAHARGLERVGFVRP